MEVLGHQHPPDEQAVRLSPDFFQPAPCTSSARRRAAMVPWVALEARPLELDMRYGVHRGNSTLVTGLDQGVRARAESDIMALSAARDKCLSSGRTTQARKSPA
jgi:hypothetical protein